MKIKINNQELDLIHSLVTNKRIELSDKVKQSQGKDTNTRLLLNQVTNLSQKLQRYIDFEFS